jgi:hypothetical protein
MLTVLRRNYGGRDDEVALAVRRLHLKVRYLDVIGTHLLTLTELYGRDDVRRVIEQDKMYLSGDADEALRLAGALLIARGIDRRAKVERKRDRTRRAVTLLIKVYETHARYGRSIFAGREDVAMTYPPIEIDGWPAT